jgi:hypothetical protein
LMAGFRLAVGLGGAALVIALLAPLAIFGAEAFRNPSMLKIEVVAQGPRLLLRVTYNGTVPLHDFKIYAGGTVIDVGTIRRGVTLKPLTPTEAAALEAHGVTGIRYSIAGLYTVEQRGGG